MVILNIIYFFIDLQYINTFYNIIDMLTDIVIGGINILGWGLKPLIEKKAVEHCSSFIFANTRYIVTAFISIFILVLSNRRYVRQHLNVKTLYFSVIVAVIGLISILSNYYLLSKYDASLVVAIVEPSLIVVTLLLGKIFFNETITLSQILGVMVIVSGLFILLLSR
jgi:uncharacterized membrane protein